MARPFPISLKQQAGSGPDHPEAEGRWSGPVNTGSALGALTLTLEDEDGTISGSGILTASGNTLGLSVSGDYDPPELAITLTSSGFEPADFTATVAEDSLSGRLNGSGFTNLGVTLHRN